MCDMGFESYDMRQTLADLSMPDAPAPTSAPAPAYQELPQTRALSAARTGVCGVQ